MKKSFPALLVSGALLLAAVSVHAADTPPVREVATLLDTPATVQAINAAPFSARGAITKDVAARLEAADELLAKLDARAAEAEPAARNAFAQARSAVLAREGALRDSVQKAAGTEAEPAWEPVRTALARDYEAYGAAATMAEATLQPPADNRP